MIISIYKYIYNKYMYSIMQLHKYPVQVQLRNVAGGSQGVEHRFFAAEPWEVSSKSGAGI